MALRFLVVEGNTAAAAATYNAAFGKTPSQSYADALRAIAPDAVCDICFPADSDARPPLSLDAYDAVFLTGSALNLYDGGAAVERQVALAKVVYTTRVPFFGSCWGIQVGCAAAGGKVVKNPKGREIGVARQIALTASGGEHPMLRGRPLVYEALCSHLDIVELPPGAVLLASNDMTPVQAAEIVHDGGVFWGVQYHPEFGFAEMASIIDRSARALAREGLVVDEDAARAGASHFRADDVGVRLNLDDSVLTQEARSLELANFIETRVRPQKSARGRA